MERNYRINWKKGLDITPEIFIAADNYHISERHLIRRFLATHGYGILPEGNFIIEKDNDEHCLYIQQLKCTALTKDGYIINIEKDTNFQNKLVFSESSGDEFYVVLSVNPLPLLPAENNSTYVYPDYNLSLVETSDDIEFGIPILKVFNNQSSWDFDTDYIPPAVAINSVDMLLEKYTDIDNLIRNTLDKISEDELSSFHVEWMLQQFNHFTPDKSPEDWILLMKKFCLFFKSCLKKEKNVDNEDLSQVMNFLAEQYNPNELEKILQLGINGFEEINYYLEEEPEEEISEIKV
jgi:predicted component of type VI protein secretion system